MKPISPSRRLMLLGLALCLIWATGCTKASKARSLLAAADRDFQKQHYDQAEREYAAVLGLSNNNPGALRQLGLIYLEEGRPQPAFKCLQDALKLDPTNSEVQLKLAEVLVSGRDMKEAEDLLRRVLRSDPGNEEALVLLAQAATNEPSAEHKRLEAQIQAGGPGLAGCYEALGWLDLRMTNLDQAENEFQKACQLEPKLASPYLGRVALCSQRGDAKGAAAALKMAAQLSPIRSATRLKYAEFKLQIGSEEEAKAMVSDMVAQAPDYIPARLFLMRLAFAEKKYDECNAIISAILNRDRFNPEAMIQAGLLAMTQHEAQKALSVFQRLNDVYNKAPEVKLYLAQAYEATGDLDRAMAILNEALALNPDYSPAVLLLAQVNNRSGNPRQSVKLLTQEIKNHPDDAPAAVELAKIYLALNQPESALELYRKMADKYPKNPEVPRLMGEVYLKQKDHPRAHAAFEQSLRAKPDYLPTLQDITSLDILDGGYSEAHARLAQVMADAPAAAEPWTLQGDIFKKEGDTNQAEFAYNKAIELNPESSDAYLHLADLYVRTKREQQALDRLHDLVAKKTNDVTTLVKSWMTIGEIQQQAGRYPEACEAYKKVLAANANFMHALNNLAYVESQDPTKLDDALELATKARALSPDDPTAADTQGWILFKQHKYDRALSAIQAGAREQGEDPEVQMHLGMAYYMTGDEESARNSLQQCLGSKVDFPDKDLARTSLGILSIDPCTATPEVVQHLLAILKQNPQDIMALSQLAAIDEQQGDARKAAELLQSMLEIRPKYSPAMIRLARLYAGKLNDPRKAFELAKEAHALSDDAQASALLGELTYRSGDFPWALSLLESAAKGITNQPSLSNNLALAYYAVGRVADAEKVMQQVVLQGGAPADLEQDKQFLAMLAVAKDPGQALARGNDVKEILAKDPNYVPALMVSALLAEQRGAVDEAARTYQKVLSIYPSFAPAMRELAILFSQHPGDLDKAYDLAEKARVTLPDDLKLTRVLGVLAYHRGAYDQSKIFLKTYTDDSPEDGDAFYYLGMDYQKLNQTNLCRQALTNALNFHVSKTLADNAEGILKQLK